VSVNLNEWYIDVANLLTGLENDGSTLLSACDEELSDIGKSPDIGLLELECANADWVATDTLSPSHTAVAESPSSSDWEDIERNLKMARQAVELEDVNPVWSLGEMTTLLTNNPDICDLDLWRSLCSVPLAGPEVLNKFIRDVNVMRRMARSLASTFRERLQRWAADTDKSFNPSD
jgi:hypothetical protein